MNFVLIEQIGISLKKTILTYEPMTNRSGSLWNKRTPARFKIPFSSKTKMLKNRLHGFIVDIRHAVATFHRALKQIK